MWMKENENAYCNCSEIHGPPLCRKFENNTELLCVLNGGTQSRYCPGAIKINELNGKQVDLYVSAHPSICRKALSKFLITY